MNLDDARRMANDLLAKRWDTDHGHIVLANRGWYFEFDDARRRFGACFYDQSRITLSRSLTEINHVEAVRDTILHEIAHALVGHKDRGHGPVWKQQARLVGASPTRCYGDDVVRPPRRWVAECPACGHVYQRDRLAKYLRDGHGLCAKQHDAPDVHRNLTFRRNPEHDRIAR